MCSFYDIWRSKSRLCQEAENADHMTGYSCRIVRVCVCVIVDVTALVRILLCALLEDMKMKQSITAYLWTSESPPLSKLPSLCLPSPFTHHVLPRWVNRNLHWLSSKQSSYSMGASKHMFTCVCRFVAHQWGEVEGREKCKKEQKETKWRMTKWQDEMEEMYGRCSSSHVSWPVRPNWLRQLTSSNSADEAFHSQDCWVDTNKLTSRAAQEWRRR